MASTFRDLLRQRLATMPGLGTGGPVATSAETRTGIPGGAAQARALAAPNQADPMGLSNQDPAFRAAQEAWALWQRKRASSAAAGGGVPQSAQSYDQLVSRGPGYGNQAARVANAQPLVAPQAPVVPQVQDIRKFEMNTQLPSGTAAPPELPPVSDAEWEAARQEQIRAFSYLTAAPNDPQAQAAYDAAVARVQDLSLRRNGPNYFTGKSAMDLLDAPRDLIVTEMGANAYDVATGKKQDWGAEWAAIAPGNWMIPGIDQTRFTQDFETWVENPANWQAIRFAAENGFQADENSPRFTGGRAVWELFINSAGTAYKVAADILLDPSILAAPAQQVGKGFTRIGAAATADARPMAATIYRGAGRALSLPQDVLDRSVDAPFNAIGDAIGGTIRYVDGKLRPGKSGILDESLYDQGVEAANTLDRSITAYEGTRPIDPDVPDAGPMPPPDGPSSPSGMPRYTMAVENGENVIRDPQGEVVERLPYQAQTGLEPPRVNRDAQRTLDRYNFDIDTAEYTQAGAVLPDRNLGWADPRYNATTRQGRDRPMTITDRAAYDATIPAEQRQAFWTEVTPQIEEHVRVMDDIRAREMSADFGRGVSYERDFVQGGTQRHTPEKAFEEVRHVAEDLIPAWRKHIQGQDVPPYQRRYTDRTSDAALIETAVFGSRDEAIAARKQLRINGTRIEGFRDGKDFVDRLAMMAKDVNGEGFLSTDPTAVRSRAYREAMRTQNPDPAAIQEVAPQVNRRVVGQTPGGNNIEQSFDPTDTTGFKSIFQSQDELIGGQYIVRQDGLGGPWQVLRSGDNTVLASFPTEEAIIIDGVAYQPGKIAARAEADRLIAALPDAVERSIDQATISAPDMAPPVLPEPKTTPQGRKKPEHMPWDDTLDDDMALRMANANVNWRTPTGNAVKGGQARSVYVIPRGSGTRGMDRVKIQWVQRRDGDMWQVFRGEVPDKNTVELATLQDAIALADEMANLIKKGMVNPDKKTIQAVAEVIEQARNVDPDEVLGALRQPQRYGMARREIGVVPTLERSAQQSTATSSELDSAKAAYYAERAKSSAFRELDDYPYQYGGPVKDIAPKSLTKSKIKAVMQAVDGIPDSVQTVSQRTTRNRFGVDEYYYRVGDVQIARGDAGSGEWIVTASGGVQTTTRYVFRDIDQAKAFAVELSRKRYRMRPFYDELGRAQANATQSFIDRVKNGDLGIINRPPNEEAAMAALRDDYGMVDGPGDTAARSAADQSHVGLAHQIGKLTTEDYDYLSQVVTYNDRPMRLWEAYEAALYDFRDDKLKAKQALVDQLMSPEVKAVMDERRMTAAERKAFNATKSKARRALDAALRPYDAWTNFYRQRIMFNWARGAAGVLADQIERTYSLSLNREYRAALTAWDIKTWWRFMQDERGKEKILDAMESVARYRKVHGKNPPADWLQMVETRFMEGGNKNVAGEGLGWVYNKTPLRTTADPWLRDARVAFDRHARYQLGMAAWDRNIADGHLRMRGLVRTQAEKNGMNGDEAVRAFDAFAKEEGGYYSGDMVYQWARDFGMVDGRAKRLGRDWAEISNGASRAADERVRKLLFSYKMTNADNILRRGMLFHYWISRAAVLHARTTLQNPWLLNAYANAWNAMEKEAEANGYPPNIIGFTKLMQSELGMYALVSPANLLVPFFFLMEGAASENQDPGVLGFIRRWGGFINPQIEAAAAILGFHNRVPDLTGTTAVRRALRVTINWLNNNGYAGLVPDAMGEEGTWQESWLDQYMVWGVGKANAFMRAVTGGENSPLNEFVTYDTGGYEQDQMQTILLDFAEAEFGGTADTWTDAQWDKYFVAQTAIMTGSKGNDLSDQAVEAFSDERLLGIGLTTVMPGGVVQRYAPRDVDLAGNRAGDPNASLRRDLATAGSPEDAELTALHERFKNLGDERETALWDGYWSIVNPDNVGDGDVLVIGNERYFGHQIKRMSEPEREALAKRWLNSYDGQAEFDAYGEKRKTFLAEHPEYGDFKEYQKGVYGYDGGVRKWRERQAIKDKQFAAEQESVRARYASQGKSGEVLEAELDGWAGSIAGYKAASGYRDSSYDPPMDETVQDFGFTADTGGGKASTPSAPKSTPQKIGDTITRYYERLDAATLQLAAAGYDESVVDLVNHPYYGATLQPFDIPEMPDEVRLYLAWQEQQPKGADVSLEAYIAFLESLALRPAA